MPTRTRRTIFGRSNSLPRLALRAVLRPLARRLAGSTGSSAPRRSASARGYAGLPRLDDQDEEAQRPAARVLRGDGSHGMFQSFYCANLCTQPVGENIELDDNQVEGDIPETPADMPDTPAGGRTGTPPNKTRAGTAPEVVPEHGLEASDYDVTATLDAPEGDDQESQNRQKLWISAWAKRKISEQDSDENPGEKIVKFSSEWEEKVVESKEIIEREARRWLRKHENFAGWTHTEHVVQTYVKEVILHADSSYDLLQKSELLIDNDWLATVDQLPGNIYRMSAFNEFEPNDKEDITWKEKLAVRSRLFGFAMILLIQLLGPPAVFLSSSPAGIGVFPDQKYNWGAWWDEDSEVGALSDWETTHTTKFLGLVFMAAFVLNACYVAIDEGKTFKKIYSTFSYLKRSTPEFVVKGQYNLLLGAFMDCWVVIWCALDAFLIIGASQNPPDLLLDALGLMFLYNLDDIGGVFGFVDEDDWAGERLGWVYEEMVQKDYQLVAKEDTGTDNAPPIEIGIYMYKITAYICGFLAFAEPILAIFCPFMAIVPEE